MDCFEKFWIVFFFKVVVDWVYLGVECINIGFIDFYVFGLKFFKSFCIDFSC